MIGGRAPRLATAAIAFGCALLVSQAFAPWPWRLGVALGIVLLVAGVVTLHDSRAATEFRRYGEGFFDGRRQAFQEVANRLGPGHSALRAFLERESRDDT